MKSKRIISLLVLFALLITAVPTQSVTVSAATEISKMTDTELDKLIEKLGTLIRQLTLKKNITKQEEDELAKLIDQRAEAYWTKYVIANKEAWIKNDFTMIRSGVEVPRPADLWAIKGYPYRTEATDGDTMRGVKIRTNWDVYLDGIGSKYYSVRVKNNTLTITGESNFNWLPHVYSVKCRFQLFEPSRGLKAYVGDDGLAYLDGYHCNRDKFVKNTATLSSNTAILVTDDGEKGDKELSFELDLSNLSDGVYCIKQQVWDTSPDKHTDGLYWYDLVVVVHNGTASLQATHISYDILPEAPDGRISYGRWWANAGSCSTGHLLCDHFY